MKTLSLANFAFTFIKSYFKFQVAVICSGHNSIGVYTEKYHFFLFFQSISIRLNIYAEILNFVWTYQLTVYFISVKTLDFFPPEKLISKFILKQWTILCLKSNKRSDVPKVSYSGNTFTTDKPKQLHTVA